MNRPGASNDFSKEELKEIETKHELSAESIQYLIKHKEYSKDELLEALKHMRLFNDIDDLLTFLYMDENKDRSELMNSIEVLLNEEIYGEHIMKQMNGKTTMGEYMVQALSSVVEMVK